MSLIKIGKRYYSGNEQGIYLLQGTATRDGEVSDVGDKPHAKVSIAAGETADGDTIFVTLNGWRDMAGQVAFIRKRDSVLAIGRFTKREYNGKTYYNLDADFVCVSGAGINAVSDDQPRRVEKPATVREPEERGFTELDDVDDGDLPF